jgi:hypothetical protein
MPASAAKRCIASAKERPRDRCRKPLQRYRSKARSRLRLLSIWHRVRS